MKRISFSLVLLTFLFGTISSGCKKIIQNAQEDAIMKLITENIWIVTNFKEGSTDVTPSFSPYEFKFNRDGSVLGKKAGQPDAVGTWQGSAETMSITSAFPSGPDPLNKLTGVWKISKTTLTSVKSSRTEGSTTFYLDLQSK